MQLLEAIKPLRRGLTATPDDQQRIDKLARQLERLNPTKKPLASDLINGQWELLYTTSESILGSNKPPFLRPLGPIYQFIGERHGGSRLPRPAAAPAWPDPHNPVCVRRCH